MPRETRTRVDIFIPVKTQKPTKRIDPAYRAIVYATIEWITVEMGFIHGGVTFSSIVSPVFTGYYRDPENPTLLRTPLSLSETKSFGSP